MLDNFLQRISQAAWRPGSHSSRDVQLDLYWLLGLALVLVGVGIGLRDPWPADEPRFALVARDMVRTGQWLIPMIGGDTYADKPPLFFWMIGAFYWLTGNLRVAFLVPSLLATLGSLALVYDLGRRLWNRETGLTAGLLLLGTVQFVWQGRQAQIDATECFWIVAGLYGLLRHVLLGPQWRWFYAGCAACGLGIITKGVGFLPLLILIPYFVLRRNTWTPRPALTQDDAWRWSFGVVALLAAICVWFVPMMLASLHSPELAAYRDEILFDQTVKRYANAWIHKHPIWYFVVDVIPPLWLPTSILLIWAIPRWHDAWRGRDLRIALLLSWSLLVLLFFSLSTGKRGVYILPALPAVCLAMAPLLPSMWSQGIKRVFWGLALFVGVLCVALGGYLLLKAGKRAEVIELYGIDPPGPLLCMGVLTLLWLSLARLKHAVLAWLGTLVVVLAVVGLWISPEMTDVRSSKDFVEQVEAAVGNAEFAWADYNEENLLMLRRPVYNFGHKHPYHEQANNAAYWLAAKPGRLLLVSERIKQACFADGVAQLLMDGNQDRWYLLSSGISAGINPDCVAQGQADSVWYFDPTTSLSSP